MIKKKLPVKHLLVVATAVLAVAVGVLITYFWQHHEVVNDNKNQAHQLTQLQSQVSRLSSTVSTDESKLKAPSSQPTYHVGDTQCINHLCITLVNFQHDPPGNSPDSNQPGTMLVSVTLTVTNNGSYPSIFANEKDIAYQGIYSGSLLYTNDNLFWEPFAGGVSGGTFVNQMQDFPKTGQTETGTLVFEIPSTETADSYLYGNLTWEL